jgi:hypothetical protein
MDEHRVDPTEVVDVGWARAVSGLISPQERVEQQPVPSRSSSTVA